MIDWLKGKATWRQSGSLSGGIFLGLCLLALGSSLMAGTGAVEVAVVRAAELSEQARETLALIKRGGPYPYEQDGAVFANRERNLPIAPPGTYREYTVKTPGRRDRGGRRIVAASTGEFWYSDDHYRTLRRIVE